VSRGEFFEERISPSSLGSALHTSRLRQKIVRYHSGHVWRILRSLGWSPQRPVGRAIERDEKAIAEWKRTKWPVIKKKPAKSTARSSSSTKAD